MPNQVTEIVSWKFKPSVTHAQAEKAAVALNDLVKKVDGFISRELYYSEENKTWVDVVVWRDAAAFKAAVKTVEMMPEFQFFPPLIDEKTVNLSYYKTITSIKK